MRFVFRVRIAMPQGIAGPARAALVKLGQPEAGG